MNSSSNPVIPIRIQCKSGQHLYQVSTIGYSVIVALTGLPIGYGVIVALTGLPIGYSVILYSGFLSRIKLVTKIK